MLRVLRSLPVILLLVIATAALGCGGDDGGATLADCGDLPFSQQAGDGAFDIKVGGGASCDLARTVAGGARSVDLAAKSLDYASAGFACAGDLVEHEGRPGIDYRCTSGEALVTFTRN